MVYSDARIFFFQTLWNTYNYNLKYSEKEHGVWWFPPYAISSRLLIRYQCIKLKYPGLYFATFSAEKQIILLRPLQYHTATAESSDHASVCPSLTDSFPSRLMGSARCSASRPKSNSTAVGPDGVFVFNWGVQSVWLFSFRSFMQTFRTPASIFCALVVIYYCCTKLQNTIPHSDQAITVFFFFFKWCNVFLIVCACFCFVYMNVCVSSQFTSLGSVLIRRSQCYLSVLAAQFLPKAHPVVASRYFIFATI